MGKIILDLSTIELPSKNKRKAAQWKKSMQQFLTYYPKGFPKNKITWGKKENISLKPLKATIALFLEKDIEIHDISKLIFETFQGIVYKSEKQFLNVQFLKFRDKVNSRIDITFEEI